MNFLANLKLLWRNRKFLKEVSRTVDTIQEAHKMGKLKSRKLWAAVIGSALTALLAQLGVPEHAVLAIAGIVVAYISGQSFVDAKK